MCSTVRQVDRMTVDNFPVRSKGTVLKKGMWAGVDAMMLLYAMKATKEVWRAQTQIPPVPQRAAWGWLKTWYERHKFDEEKQVLVFTIDSRRCVFKVSHIHIHIYIYIYIYIYMYIYIYVCIYT